MTRFAVFVLAVLFPMVAMGQVVPEAVPIPEGPFLFGSTAAEKEIGYRLDAEGYGHNRTRELQWYAREPEQALVRTGAYDIMVTPVTNRAYADFVTATGHPAPDVAPATWAGYRLNHPYARTRRHAWQNGTYPEGRADHPVVMVSHADAMAYGAWLSSVTGDVWRLPSEVEWEKAARGVEGNVFPWGADWDATRLNTADTGPFDTVAVGQFPDGASPFGLLDAAGQVFEWTATPQGAGRYTVKGGSWDDKGCGVCRPAAGHGRPEAIKHILVGFRLVREHLSK